MNYGSEKIRGLKPYLFSEIQQRKKKIESQGIKVIDLGIGAPDLATPEFIIDVLQNEAKLSMNHKYPPYQGIPEFKHSVANFYHKRYGVALNPETEVLALIGSKEGIAHFVQSIIDPNDLVLVPNPVYPVYQTSVYLSGGIPIDLPLNEHGGFSPMFNKLSEEILHKAKLMILNYPNNPTAATADKSMFSKIVTLAKQYRILIAHDAAYDLMTFGNYKSPSILQIPGAKDIAIEFGSLSKSFNMTGWRIGYAVGNEQLIQALATLKSNLDTSQFIPIQKAAAAALSSNLEHVIENNKIFEERINKMYDVLLKMGLVANKPRGTFYLWAKVPKNYKSMDFANKLLDEAGIIVTPGTAFGSRGEGYIRISLTVDVKLIDEIEQRLQKIKF